MLLRQEEEEVQVKEARIQKSEFRCTQSPLTFEFKWLNCLHFGPDSDCQVLQGFSRQLTGGTNHNLMSPHSRRVEIQPPTRGCLWADQSRCQSAQYTQCNSFLPPLLLRIRFTSKPVQGLLLTAAGYVLWRYWLVGYYAELSDPFPAIWTFPFMLPALLSLPAIPSRSSWGFNCFL